MEILVYLLLVVAGVVIGIAVARLSFDKQRVGKVEAERDAAKQALADYRQQVTDHFQHTGELFDRITADYRSLYEHLASGATELCDAPRQDVLQAEPERRRLTDAVAESESGGEDTEAAAAGEQAETASGSAGPDPVRAGVAGAAVGAAAAAAASTDSTPDETDSPAKAVDASETASAQDDGAAGTDVAGTEAAAADADAETPPPRGAASADGEAPEAVKKGDGEATAAAAEPAEDAREEETDDKPALAVNGHYRAEGAEAERKSSAP